MKTILKVRAPVRIDLAGGTTDIYPFTHKFGGAVLNASINKYIHGKIIKTNKKVHLEYTGEIPTSSGLGTSGVMNLVWLSLISEIKSSKKKEFSFKDKLQLAEQVYELEQSLGLVGGKQDQYAAAFGGINFLEFKKDKVIRTSLNLSKSLISTLEKNLVLVYTGKPHFSGNANQSMINNLKKGKNTKSLCEIKKIAILMKNALLKKDLSQFSDLLNKETEYRRQLAKNIIPPHVEKIIKKGKSSGALAAKVCGSGNGGSVLFYGNKLQLKKIFKENVIDFKFDFEGLKKSNYLFHHIF